MLRLRVLQAGLASGVLLALLVSVLQVATAQVATSSSYRIQTDSINFGGGYSTSSEYIQESTFGEIATGRSTSTSYQLRAGYLQLQTVFISVAVSGNADMDQAILGITGGTANGSTTATVITDNPAGYELTITAESDPAMEQDNGNAVIADYPASTTPDDAFTVSAGEAFFGFTVEGNDIYTPFLDDGAGACGGGSQDNPDNCWRGLDDAAITVARRQSSNHPAGSTTTLKFRVGVGSGAGVLSGTYTATTTVTAIPL